MGCENSKSTAVQPLGAGELQGDEDETAGKLEVRGDSAVSKGTTDSGVVMESREVPGLPGAVPRKLPPLTCVGESDVDRVTPGDSQKLERQKSSEILEELLSQGIIPEGSSAERSAGAGEAYSIMLDEEVRRKPPARLESLKAKKEESVHSREELEEKIRLAEERRKLKEEELKTRLRSKSARIRQPATCLPQEVTEMTDEDDEGEEEETTQVEELEKDEVKTDMAELESDSTFLPAEHKREIF